MIHEFLKLKLSYIKIKKKKNWGSNSSANKVNTNHKIKLLAYVTNFINYLMNIALEDWLKNINIIFFFFFCFLREFQPSLSPKKKHDVNVFESILMIINYFATNTITYFTISSKKKKKKTYFTTCWDEKLWMVMITFI